MTSYDEESAYRFKDFSISPRMVRAIKRYIEHGIGPGHFLTAVICNDLRGAVWQADEENMRNLPAFVTYFYNEAPSTCWGSHEKMVAWMNGMRDDNKQG